MMWLLTIGATIISRGVVKLIIVISFLTPIVLARRNALADCAK